MGNNLGRTPIAESQVDSQFLTSNDNDSVIDDAITDALDVVLSSTSESLTAAQLQRNFTFRLSDDSPDAGGPITLSLPVEWQDEESPANTIDLFRGSFFVINDSLYPVTVQISGQPNTAPVVPAGGQRLLVHDGVNVYAPSVEYDFGMWMPTTPGTGDIISQMTMVRPLWIPADFAGSRGSINTNPTATFEISVKVGGVEIGTISVSTGGALTFATTGNAAKTIAVGETVQFVAPGTPDATAAGLDAMILGYTT